MRWSTRFWRRRLRPDMIEDYTQEACAIAWRRLCQRYLRGDGLPERPTGLAWEACCMVASGYRLAGAIPPWDAMSGRVRRSDRDRDGPAQAVRVYQLDDERDRPARSRERCPSVTVPFWLDWRTFAQRWPARQQTAMTLYHHGYSGREVSAQVEVDVTTLSRWRRAWRISYLAESLSSCERRIPED